MIPSHLHLLNPSMPPKAKRPFPGCYVVADDAYAFAPDYFEGLASLYATKEAVEAESRHFDDAIKEVADTFGWETESN